MAEREIVKGGTWDKSDGSERKGSLASTKEAVNSNCNIQLEVSKR
jgi:hypothetical protein